MKLPFGSSVPSYYYEMALGEAAGLLGASAPTLTSLKVRPVAKWPIERDEDFHNAYVYPSEYALIYKAIDASQLRRLSEGHVSQGKAIALGTPAGDRLVFVEHETGPEIVAALALAAASVSLLKEVVSLVREILKGVNEKNEAKRKGASADRYYQAAAISIEERTPGSSRLIRVIPLPLKETDLDEAEIQRLLRST